MVQQLPTEVGGPQLDTPETEGTLTTMPFPRIRLPVVGDQLVTALARLIVQRVGVIVAVRQQVPSAAQLRHQFAGDCRFVQFMGVMSHASGMTRLDQIACNL